MTGQVLRCKKQIKNHFFVIVPHSELTHRCPGIKENNDRYGENLSQNTFSAINKTAGNTTKVLI